MSSQKNRCSACGGFNFNLNDGFMYCNLCGTLLENFEEIEQEPDDPANLFGKAKIKQKKKRSDVKSETKKKSHFDNVGMVEKMQESQVGKTDFLSSQVPKNETLPYDLTPDYLYRVGLRLSTFTQMLKRCVYVLVHDMHFPKTLTDVTLSVFQEYLKHCEIAFTPSEKPETDADQLISILENINYETERRETKKRKTTEKKTRGLKALSQSIAAWQLLTQGDLTENLEMDAESEEEEEEPDGMDDETMYDTTMGFVRKVATGLSKEAVRRASQIRLNTEMLIVILFTSSQCAGCKNVLLSDFVRWVREDRFRISMKQLILCQRAGHEKLMKKLNQGEPKSGLDQSDCELQVPICEIDRVCRLFNQSLDLSKNMALPSFSMLSARMIENLNLPIDFLRRIILLQSIIPCDFSLTSRRQGNVKNGRNVCELTNMPPRMMFDAFMKCFRENDSPDQIDIEHEVFLSNDTKIMAYVLLAIKLTYNIDSEKVKSFDLDSEFFDIDTWMHQFEMRIKCWQGHDMTMVLRKTCPIPELQQEKPFQCNSLPTFNNVNEESTTLRRRQIFFRKCIPSSMSFNSTQNLPTVFKTRANSIGDAKNLTEAVLAPLKFQRRALKKEMNETPDLFENCDDDSIDTFFKSFSKVKVTESTDKFSTIFPASKKYVRYSRPDRTSNCSTKIDFHGPEEGDYLLYLSIQTCDDLYNTASMTFSTRFRTLLENCALIIGEEVKVLYAAFVMLETNLLEADRLQTIRETLLNDEYISVHNWLYSRTGNYSEFDIGVKASTSIDKIEDLNIFHLSAPMRVVQESSTFRFEISSDSDDEDGNDSESSKISSDNMAGYRNILRSSRYKQIKVRNSYTNRRKFYNFETLFSILAIKYW